MNENKISKMFEKIGLNIKFDTIHLNLPMIYQQRYTYKEVVINDSLKMLFVHEKRAHSLESFIKQVEYLSEKMNLPYVLVFASISEDIKQLLIKKNISFIDYKGNIFITKLGMLLNRQEQDIEINQFIPTEQATLIYLLLNDKNDFTVKTISKDIEVSTPSIYRAIKTFINNGWLFSKDKTYRFTSSKREIYNEAKKYFIKPIDKIIYIDQKVMDILNKNIFDEIKIAGTWALSKWSMLDEPNEIYALSSKDFLDIEDNDKIEYFDRKIKNEIEVQLWKYKPICYKDKNKNTIDPISLYLSLSDDNDPRIQLALEEMMSSVFMKMEE